MIVDDTNTAACEIVLVTADDDHAARILADLQSAPSKMMITRVSASRAVASALAHLAAAGPRPIPALVIVDYEFLGGACETIVGWVLGMKARTALECLVTRPPPYGPVGERLRRKGAFLFDPDFDIAAPQPVVH